MGSLPDRVYSPSQLQKQHKEMLENAVAASFRGEALIASYKRSFNGFAAYLTEQEKQQLARHDEVVSIFPSKTLWPQTTRSWDYMALNENMVKDHRENSSNIIIGSLDSGIWPESESFSDQGFGPILKKWKGVCNGGQNFTCNQKLIGARHYRQGLVSGDVNSTRDTDGHGTHTASIAAGNLAKNASFYGIARGTARGGLPSARIAAYKVCSRGCSDSAILSAFDDAIADGVDIITISVGSETPEDIGQDSVAIGSLHAMQKGVLTVQAAGNNGFVPGKVNGIAPWILSVAASTMDRGIITKITLGNGKTIVGKSINSFELNGRSFPLVYGRGATKKCRERDAKICLAECLDNSLVKGKIVLCDVAEGANEAFRAGAVGAIIQSGLAFDVSLTYPLPTSSLATKDYSSVQAYAKCKLKNCKAFISSSEAIRNVDAPKVASFSSKGPNAFFPNILKPDITAPGVEILAAFSPVASVSTSSDDKRSVNYQIQSGTSMACPHAAGAAAFIKSVHPNWSISAIKSALMTTAMPMDHTKGNEFSFGAGHLNPVKAMNPGLVYETDQGGYIKLLCKLGYSDQKIQRLFRNNTVACMNIKDANAAVDDFNYPSMTIRGKKNAPLLASFTRTVTNVGNATSTYTARVDAAQGLRVTVEPQTLSFQKLNERKTFAVKVKVDKLQSTVSASLVWSDGMHSARSPIVAYWELP